MLRRLCRSSWSVVILATAIQAQPDHDAPDRVVCGTRLLAQRAARLPLPAAAGVGKPVQQAPTGDITVGTQLEFPVAGSPILLPATCRYAGDHGYVFVEDRQWDENGGSVLQSHADGIGELFDLATPADPARGIYELSTQAFGEAPDVDGHEQIFILILDIADPLFVGFFDPRVADHPVPELRRDVIYLDERAVRRSTYLARGTLAHEFQHLIHWGHDADEEAWVNEGLSGYAEELAGFPEADPNAVPAFLSRPDVDFTNWPAAASPAYYGSTYLLVSHLAERFGQPFIRDLVAQPRNGRFGVDDTLEMGGTGEDFLSAWARWIVANYAYDDLAYGYSALQGRRVTTSIVEELPLSSAAGQLDAQWGTATILFRTPGDLSIEFDGEDSARFRVWAYSMRQQRGELEEFVLDGGMRGTLTATTIDSLALIVGKTSSQGGSYVLSARPSVVTAVVEATAVGGHTALATPFPNPFNSAVTIPFHLVAPGAGTQLTIYSATGQPVRRWHLRDGRPGPYEVVWDGRDESGRTVASGAYSVELTAASGTQVRRLTHLK